MTSLRSHRSRKQVATLGFALACLNGLADEVVKAPELVIVEQRPAGLFQAANETPIVPTYRTSLWGELTGKVANVYISDSGSSGYGSLVAVRGLSNTPYFGDPALTFYVNDVPLAGSASVPTLVPGMWSASWVRGPQAAFTFGRASSGGTLVLNSFRAMRNLEGSARVFFGDFNQRGFAVDQRVAAGALDAQASVVLSQRDGYIENNTLGEKVDDQDHRAAAARVRYQLGSKAEVSLQYFGSQARDGAQPLVPLGGPWYDVEREREGSTRIDFHGLALKAVAVTPLATVSSVTSFTDWKMDPYTNSLVLPPAFDSSVTQSQTTWNEELKFTSLAEAKFPWSAGVWWSHSDSDGGVARNILGTIPIEASDFTLKQDTVAVYGQSTLMSEDGWSVDAGLRAEYHGKRFTRQETVPGETFFRRSFGTTRFVPRIGTTAILSPASRINLAWSAGFKPGGFSSYTGNRALSKFEVEKTSAWEVTWQQQLAAHTSLVIRGYRYDTKNYQIERSFTATDYLVVNAPKARSQGIEVETSISFNRVLINVSAGWQDSLLKSFTDPFTQVSYSRKSTPYAPRSTARIEAIYTPATNWQVMAAATRVGRVFYDEGETLRYSQGQYDLLEASVSYTLGRWKATVSGTNLADQRYYSLIVPGVEHGVPGAPRTWRAEVGYSW